MIRQLFDSVSGTYTYLLASRLGGVLIIDPVLEKVERYLQLISELDLKLVKAIDTHLHADHHRFARCETAASASRSWVVKGMWMWFRCGCPRVTG
jgi:glyoxylase-like metal-dependent hydrolase (beta-lactamase superfamily II)